MGVSSIFGGMMAFGTITVSGTTGMNWLRETVVVDDLVEMRDMAVNLVAHPVVSAYPHLVSHHSVLVVIELMCEMDHHREEDSRYSACVDRLA